jgi:hypothetical protein
MIAKAIKAINPNAQFTVNAEDYNQITWLNGTTPIPKEQILAIIPQVELDMAMADLRARRNKDLQDSDWTQLPDNTLTSEQRNAWMQFRTELRNITNGLNTVEQVKNVDYPDKP